MTRVSVVIVTYNSADWIDACLERLDASVTPPELQLDVVVVDNASTDDTLGRLERHSGLLLVIKNSINEGFAAAVNKGARAGLGDWLLLLNPDCLVSSDAIAKIVGFAESMPGHGLYGGRNTFPDGRTDPSSCWGLPTLWSLLCFATGMSTLARGSRIFDPESLGPWERDSVRTVPAISGAFLLVNRNTWDRLGGLDEDFWVYGEDVDLAARARSLGLSAIVTPAASVEHANGASSSTRVDKMTLVMAGKITYATKHFSGPRRHIGTGLLVCGVWLRATISRSMGKPTVWVGVWEQRNNWRSGFPERPAPAGSPSAGHFGS